MRLGAARPEHPPSGRGPLRERLRHTTGILRAVNTDGEGSQQPARGSDNWGTSVERMRIRARVQLAMGLVLLATSVVAVLVLAENRQARARNALHAVAIADAQVQRASDQANSLRISMHLARASTVDHRLGPVGQQRREAFLVAQRGYVRALAYRSAARARADEALAVNPQSLTLPIAALLALGAALTVVYLRERARAQFVERQHEAAQERADEALDSVTEDINLRALLLFNRKQMEAYESLTRGQAASSYRLSHVALAVGLVVLVGAALSAIIAPDAATKAAAATLGTVGGAISGYVARTYLRIYERTLQQLNHYFEQPLVSSYVLTAERLVEKMSDGQRDEALARIITELFAWRHAPAENSI